MEKVDNMKEHRGNVSREMDILKIKKKYQNLNTLNIDESTFDGKMTWILLLVDWTWLRKKTIPEIEDISIKNFQKLKRKNRPKRNKTYKNYEITTKG